MFAVYWTDDDDHDDDDDDGGGGVVVVCMCVGRNICGTRCIFPIADKFCLPFRKWLHLSYTGVHVIIFQFRHVFAVSNESVYATRCYTFLFFYCRHRRRCCYYHS